MKVKLIIKKITLLMLITMSSSTVFAISGTKNNSISASTSNYVIESEMSPYELSLKSGVPINILNQINGENFSQQQTLKVGTEIKLPSHSKLVKSDLKNSETEANHVLPQLSSTEATSIGEGLTSQVLNYSGANHFIGGSTDENVANALSSAATTDWNELSLEELGIQIEERVKTDLKNKALNEINNTAQNLLGRFGKAEVSLSVSDDGKIEGSSLNLLSPLFDQNENLVFSQLGIHGQGSGEESRTIGNFGLGYRYEAKDWLGGSNLFIDHDFTGSNTRLGLGAEYWRDNLKLASNVYTPLSGWKESGVMKHFEQLIYDERAAKGFDIRAKAYLPNYPQLGGTLVYEQYFGDEVDLFGIENRQKDPYAMTLGLNYTPIPLLTTEMTHKMGKSGQEDTRLNLNMNLQLGTPIEQQLDPSNVASTRSLKGSRYDMVDRNYDIVFEYKKEDFHISISGASEANLGDIVAISSSIRSRAPIDSYEWIVEKGLSSTIQSENKPNLNLLINSTETHIVRLKVRTVRGYEAISEPLYISVGSKSTLEAIDGKSDLVTFKSTELISFEQLDNNDLFEEMIKIEGDSQRVDLIFNGVGVDEEIFKLQTSDALKIEFRFEGEENFRVWSKGAALETGLYIAYSDIVADSTAQISVVANEKVLVEGEKARKIEIKVSSSLVPAISAQHWIQVNKAKELPKEIDPNNLIIQIVEVQDTSDSRSSRFSPSSLIVSESGVLDGKPIETYLQPIKQGTEYEARILSGSDPKNLRDVTNRYVDSIVWLYFDPMTQSEVSTKDEMNINGRNKTYRSLEDCRGKSTYLTQKNNFEDNELSWGEIFIEDNEREQRIVTEQGLRLSVQFDYLEFHEPKDLGETQCKRKLQGAVTEYIGFKEAEFRSKLWSKAE